MSGEGARYRFGPRERGGALAGWRAGQILTVALGLVVGVLILRAEPNVAGVGVAVLILAACGAMATWPVSGRTGDQWLPVVVRWGTRRFSGAGLGRGLRGMDSLAGLRVLSVGSHDMGVVHDRRGRTLTAGLSVRGRGFALLGPDEQDRRVAGWSSVLATLAREGSLIRRVQWMAASFPDQGRRCAGLPRGHAHGRPGVDVCGLLRGVAQRDRRGRLHPRCRSDGAGAPDQVGRDRRGSARSASWRHWPVSCPTPTSRSIGCSRQTTS